MDQEWARTDEPDLFRVHEPETVNRRIRMSYHEFWHNLWWLLMVCEEQKGGVSFPVSPPFLLAAAHHDQKKEEKEVLFSDYLLQFFVSSKGLHKTA